MEIQLEHEAERRRAGRWLFGWGLASLLVGGVSAAVWHDERVVFGAGLTAASFGAINAALGLPMMDLGRNRVGRIRANTEPADTLRASLVAGQYRSGQVFALNAGLDVFYVATGAMMVAFERRGTGDRALLGAGVAMITQGLFLLIYDLVEWAASNRRAAELS